MLKYTVQYDCGEESSHVFSSLIEGENVKQVITTFEQIFKDYRILSVELVPERLVKPERWEELCRYQQQARNRVIDCLPG